MMTPLDKAIELYSVSKTGSDVTRHNVRELGQHLAAMIPAKFPEVPVPIIAGGAVRDAAFGLTPKDYDIFVDVSNLHPDEAEDLCFLIADELIQDLANEEYKNYPPSRLGKDGSYEGITELPEKFFHVYESFLNTTHSLQVIGRREKPLDTIASFDYNLVRAMYEPVSDEFIFHDSFWERPKDNVIEADTIKTYRRIRRWLERHPCLNKEWTVKPPSEEKIVEERAKFWGVNSLPTRNLITPEMVDFNLLA